MPFQDSISIIERKKAAKLDLTFPPLLLDNSTVKLKASEFALAILLLITDQAVGSVKVNKT